jgi:HK97 family phage major capsid protein
MKKTFLQFQAKTNLPRITSRRMRIGSGRHNIAYKSDGNDDDDADIDTRLKTLETTLEGKLTKSAKTMVLAEIKSLQDEVAAMKAAGSTITEDRIKQLETALASAKAAADLNQPVIDAFVANKDRHTVPAQQKSFGEVLGDAITEAGDALEKFRRKETKSVTLDLKVVGDMTTANVTGGSRYGQIMAPGIIEQPNRRVHVRQLVGTSPAGPGNTYTFMKENGAGEGAIAPTAETATKPQIDLDLIEATVNFETLAGWLRISRKMLNNVPGLTAFLQSRLPEKLLRVEDAQILYGDGNTPNLKGIGTAGNFTAATSTEQELSEALIDAISQLEDTNERYATGILVRPKAYYNFFKNKASGSGEYDLPRNFVFTNGVLYVSGIPVYASTAVTNGDYFVGDWDMGADLLIQEAMRIEFFEQDGTNVRENKITVRIEETVALPVYGSDYFIKGNDTDQS